jgi:hypothetical protein
MDTDFWFWGFTLPYLTHRAKSQKPKISVASIFRSDVTMTIEATA